MAKKDYYDVLGVERGADEKAIKRAYKVDFEKYYPNGKVDIYISICPHC